MNQPSSQPQEIHLQDYINVILRRQKTILIAFSTVFAGVVLYTFLATPVYEATTTLHVRDEKVKNGLLVDLGLSMQNPLETEIEILKSRTNAEEVVRRLHLDWVIDRKSEDLSFRLLDFSTSSPRPAAYTVVVTGPETFEVKGPRGKEIGSGKSDTLFRGDNLMLYLADLKGNPGDRFRLRILPFNETVEQVRKGTQAKEAKKKTNIITLSYRETDPIRAKEVVNTLAQVYLDHSVAMKTQEASKTLDFIDENMAGVRKELDDAEKRLQEYKSAAGVVKLDTEAESLVQALSENERQKTEITLQKRQLDVTIKGLKEAIASGAPYSPSAMKEDPLVSGMASRLAELEVQKRSLLSEYKEAHPEVKKVQDEINELRGKILGTYVTALKTLSSRDVALDKVIQGYEIDLKKLPEAERELAGRVRHSKVNADIYTFLLQKHEEARIAKAATISNITVIDPAIAPEKPVKPQKKKNILVGFLLGCMVGLGIAFFREYLDDTVKDEDEARRVLGVPVLAVIPFIKRKEVAGKMDAVMVTHLDPRSPVAEAFRGLRTSMHFSSVNRGRRIILITSSFPGEGKSSIAANLAVAMSQTGKKVVILDCDLRRPSLHEKFGHSKDPGMTNILAGDVAFDKAVHATGIAGFDFVSGGTLPPNPAELLGSVGMRNLLDDLATRYDHILIDAPPVLSVTDAPVLTSAADMVVLVVEAGRVPVKALQKVKEILDRINAPLVGGVMNDKNSKNLPSYGYYGYYLDAAEKKEQTIWSRIVGRFKL